MNNADRINLVYAAFGRGDVASIIEMTRDDVDWGFEGDLPDTLAWLRAGRGRNAVLGYFGGVVASMDIHSFVPKLVLAQGDEVLTLVELDFTVKATGKRLRTSEAMHFTFDQAGRIARYRPILDTAQRIAAS